VSLTLTKSLLKINLFSNRIAIYQILSEGKFGDIFIVVTVKFISQNQNNIYDLKSILSPLTSISTVSLSGTLVLPL